MSELKGDISWHEKFMAVAILAACRSKDPNTRCGACIVKDNHIIGTGYNGLTVGMLDTPEIWSAPTKYRFVKHAERNAIDHADKTRLKGASMYVFSTRRYSPCSNCCLSIVDSGISFVYVLPRQDTPALAQSCHDWDEEAEASAKMFSAAGVHVVELDIDLSNVILSFMHASGISPENLLQKGK